MKLYYSPGACSLSPHIVLREAELEFSLVKVDTKAKKTASGADFSLINPKGYVPVLELDNGEVLTEPIVREKLLARLGYVDQALENKTYLLGDTFTVADAYLFTVTNWTAFVGLDIKNLSKLGQYMGRVRERPAVQAALEAEGLNK